MTEEQKKLVEENHNLIYSFLYQHNLQVDEYYDIAAIEMCKAAINFDGVSSKFSTYAYKCMLNGVRMDMRKAGKPKRGLGSVVYYQEAIDKEELEGKTYDCFLAANDNIEDEVISKLMMEETVSQLKDKEKLVLSLLMNGYRQEDIGTILGCTQSRVSRIRSKLKKQLTS